MTIDDRTLRAYRSYLMEQERERSTIEKYGCCVTAFVDWLDGRTLTKEEAVAWKEELKSRCAPATVNAALAALNGFFRFLGRDDCRLKFLKVQRRVFRDQSRELTQQEFRRLAEAAAAHGCQLLLYSVNTSKSGIDNRHHPQGRTASIALSAPSRTGHGAVLFSCGYSYLYNHSFDFGVSGGCFLLHDRSVTVDEALRTDFRGEYSQNVRCMTIEDHITARSRLGEQGAAAPAVERVVQRINLVRQTTDAERPASTQT